MESRLASTAVAMPTEEVPPRIRMDTSGWASRLIVNEPYAACSISGTAACVAQSRLLVNDTTWRAGTQGVLGVAAVERGPMPPINVADL